MYNISIGRRTFIVLFCTTMILFSILTIIANLTFNSSYKNLEQRNVSENMQRISGALSARMDALETLSYDWANWDDLYRFAQDKNPDFIETNLGDMSSYSNMGISLFFVADNSGQIIFGKALNLADSKEIILSDSSDQYLLHSILKGTLNDKGQRAGVILLNGSPVLAVSSPILKSDLEGPSDGTLIMGYFIDDVTVSEIAKVTHLELTPLNINYPDFPADLNTYLKLTKAADSTFTQILSRDKIAGFITLKDVYGNSVLVFRTIMDREIFTQGQQTMAYLNISLLFMSAMFFFVFVYVINKTVLNRMTALSQSVNVIGTEGDVSKRVSIPGKDELSSLADNINRMLESIEKSQTEIHAQKEFIDRILTTSPNAVVVVDKSQNIVMTNIAFNTMFDFDAIKFKNKKIKDIRDLFELSSETQKFIDSRASSSKTELHNEGNGVRKTLSVSFTRMKDDALFLIIFTDITLEMDRQDRLYLTDRLASVGNMAAGVAHEINNPLSSILGLSELLSEEALPAGVREDLVTINGEARRAAGIVKNMLSFARKHTPTKQPVQMNDVIEDVLRLRDYQLKISNITTECNLEPNLPKVMADYFQIQQVFFNIITNAEQSMSKSHGKGTLKITSEFSNGMVKITFTDDGEGITEKNLGHIFDPFFTTKEVGTGTGLGLSICYGIVTSHGGQIYAQSEIGKGATFIVELPV